MVNWISQSHKSIILSSNYVFDTFNIKSISILNLKHLEESFSVYEDSSGLGSFMAIARLRETSSYTELNFPYGINNIVLARLLLGVRCT